MSVLAGLVSLLGNRVARWALIAGAAVLAMLFVFWRVHAAGRAAERAANQARILEIRDDQLDAYINRPRGRDAVVERLRDGTF